MTEETKSIDSLPNPAQTDCLLQLLVSLVNNPNPEVNLEIGVTLQVSGMLVSGDLVSADVYLEGFISDFTDTLENNPEVTKSIERGFSRLHEVYEQKLNMPTVELQPQYIHLKGARFFNTVGNPIPANRGVWWRGRICEVGGFSLGSLSVSG